MSKVLNEKEIYDNLLVKFKPQKLNYEKVLSPSACPCRSQNGKKYVNFQSEEIPVEEGFLAGKKRCVDTRDGLALYDICEELRRASMTAEKTKGKLTNFTIDFFHYILYVRQFAEVLFIFL